MRYSFLSAIIFLILQLCCVISSEFEQMSTSVSGHAFSNGAGWNGRAVTQLQVDDHGNVCFLAPMPEHENSVDGRFIASYINKKETVSLVHSGLDDFSAMLGLTLRTTNTEIKASSDFLHVAILCDERLSSATTTTTAILYLQDQNNKVQDKIVLGQSPECLASECHLEVGDGCLLVYGHGYGMKLFDISSGKLLLLHDFSNTIEYDGEFLAMPKNANSIFFATTKSGYGLNIGQNGIFCYSISTGQTTLVAQAGRTSFDTQLDVSGDGGTVAFRRLDNTITIAKRDGAVWETTNVEDKSACYPSISFDGRFVVYQCTEDNTGKVKVFDTLIGKCSMVIESSNGDCYRPAISQNGNYIAFVSNSTNDSTYQVFRIQNDILQSGDDWILMDLQKGWNLKSIHFTLNDKSQQMLEKLGVIWIWDRGHFVENTKNLKQGMGFWIYSYTPQQVFLSGTIDELPPIRMGWNLVCPRSYSRYLSEGHAFIFDDKSSSYVNYSKDNNESSNNGLWLYWSKIQK